MPMVRLGKTQPVQLDIPDAGNQRKFTAKSIIKSIPCQKLGMEYATNPKVVDKLSKIEYCFTADIIPKVSPNTVAMVPLNKASLTETGYL